MTTPGGWSPVVRVDRYTVSVLPEGHIDAHTFDIEVEYRGGGRWAVTHHRYCLGADGAWEYEQHPSERTEEWLALHRFTETEALDLARRAAPSVRINGITAAELAARTARATGRTHQTEDPT